MSELPQVRRADKLMPEEEARGLVARGYCGHLASVGADGWPYVVPLLYVLSEGEIWTHNTRASGHLRANVDHDPRVCFTVAEPGEVFPYGRFECDTTIAYRSAVVFGRIRVADDRAQKQAFFSALMAKYADAQWERPRDFFPRLDQVTVYAIAIERITGKTTPLPAREEQWPAVDRTKSPQLTPPSR